MKKNTLNVGIVAAFFLFLSVHGTKECKNIKYVEPNVQEKPELLVVKQELKLDYQTFEIEICFAGKKYFVDNLTLDHEGSFYDEFEYDHREHTVYAVKQKFHPIHQKIFSIQRIDLDRKKESTVFELLSNDTTRRIHSIALDWVTKNLHFSDGKELKVLNVDNPSKSPTSLYTFKEKYFNTNLHVNVVRVFPNQGYLVVKTSQHAITRFDQDGSNPMVLYEGNAINDLALDYNSQDVYWIENVGNSSSQQIRYTNLNGGGVKNFEVADRPSNLTSHDYYDYVAVDEKYVYYVAKSFRVSEDLTHLRRARKVDGVYDRSFEIVENKISKIDGWPLARVSVFSRQPQEVAEDHPCLNSSQDNCEGFCVAVPDKNKKLFKKCINAGSGHYRRCLHRNLRTD